MRDDNPQQSAPPVSPRLIVGIGASAGGLAPIEALLGAAPAKLGVAYVVVQHLSAEHKSNLVGLLERHAQLPVAEVRSKTRAQADHVYVAAPGDFLRMDGGTIVPMEPPGQRGGRMPIDFFFRALAEDQREKACAVVLSGAGSDGTLGIRAIKAHGGLVFAQDPASAEYGSMPASALATDLVDCELKPGDIPKVIAEYVHHAQIDCDLDDDAQDSDGQIAQILNTLRGRTGRDFRHYKRGTLLRRIHRRLGLQRIDGLAEYAEFLRTSPSEVETLAHDLLIKVTAFFRDPEVWREVETKVIEKLVSECSDDDPIRIWVPACSTGEESYTIAMLVHEVSRRNDRPVRLQMFASDVDQAALSVARSGYYPQSISGDLSPERLAAFFTLENGMYRVREFLRESIVFAPQDILADPPFSKLDFMSCRNLLIYLESEMQRRVLTLCHFALNNHGFLLLGASETVGQQSDLFEPVSKILRLYRRVGPCQRGYSEIPLRVGRAMRTPAPTPVPRAAENRYAHAARDQLLRHYAPPAVVIDSNYQTLFYCGGTNRYLIQPEGAPTRDIFALVQERLRAKLRGALHQAMTQNAQSSVLVGAGAGGDEPPLRMTVAPMHEHGVDEQMYLIAFENASDEHGSGPELEREVGATDSLSIQLDRELRTTREQLNQTIEQLESSNEELQSSHEEAMSMNEELQSANEELETSKEELQSLNEELNTVNAQLREKVDELESLNNDLSNLLSSSSIATIFLDTTFCIKRFTPAMAQLLNLRTSDVGRPLVDLNLRFDDAELMTDAQTVLKELAPLSREVRTDNGRWLIRRILPYRTQDNRIDGVVITLLDITERREMEDRLRESESQLRLMADSLPALISFVDTDECYQFNNAAYLEWFGLPPEHYKGKHMANVLGATAYNQLKPYVERVLAGENVTFERKISYAEAGERYIRCAYVPQKAEDGTPRGFFALVHDITDRRRMEEDLQVSENRYRSLIAATTSVVWVTDAEGRFVAPQKSWEEYTGQTWESHRDYGWLDAMHPEDRERLFVGWRRALRDQHQYREEGRIWSQRHEEYRYFGARAVPIGDEGETAREWVGTITDIHDRKIREDVQTRLAAIVSDSDDAIYGKTLEGTITSWNQGAERMYGYTAEEIIGKRVSLLVPDHQHDDFEETMQRIRNGERIEQHEVERRAKDGRHLYVSLTVSPIKDANGSIIAASSIARDVTERILFERALRESEERLRTALAASNTGTLRWDFQTDSVYWDENVYRLFGLDEALVVQRLDEFLALVHADDRHMVSESLEHTRNSGRDFELEFRTIWPDGSIHWLLTKGKALLDPHEAPAYMTGACADITRRKRAEQALEESEARFRGTFEEAAVGISHVDRNGRWLRMNQRVCDILGYSRRELAQLKFQDVTHEGDVNEDWRRFSALMSGAINSYSIEKRYRHKDGKTVWVQLTASVQRDDEGVPQYAIRIIEDISARKEAERALHEINETLERRVAERTQSLVHYQEQLRALASELTVTAETERRRLATELHDFLAQQLVVCQLKLSQIRRHSKSTEADIMIRELDELLADSVRYTRSLIAELSPSILYDAGLAAALRWLSDQMQQHGLSVHVSEKRSISEIPEDQAILLFQAGRELLFNVVKHAGTDEAWVSVDERDGNIVVTVRDQGNGFDVSQHATGPTMSGRFGLFSVRERVEAMGGELHIRSIVGEGTEASIWLPIGPANTPLATGTGTSEPAGEPA